MAPTHHDATIVICTALDTEYRAVHSHFAATGEHHTERGTHYELLRLDTATTRWRIVLLLGDRGNDMTAVQVERAVATFAPRAVLLIGIAGGRADSRHGDVVAATEIYDYETGRDNDQGFRPRIKTLNSSYQLVQLAHRVSREGRWRRRIRHDHRVPPPHSRVAPLAAGGKVVGGNRSRTARLIDRYCGDAQGVETEGIGLLRAGYANRAVATLVIRGISDLLSDKHSKTDDFWQPVAADHAAAFAVELLHQWEPAAGTADTVGNNTGRTTPDTYLGAQGAASTAYIAAQGHRAHGVINIGNPPYPHR